MEIKAMRDVFLQSLYEHMQHNEKIFFVTADFGSPILDKIREEYPKRFINVGIAEQNLINIATGLALEGFTVYAYAIAPFITMRCFEQIRVNIAILSQIRPMNINLIGVGAGVSYAMSGPTHHCLEDLSIMNTLPNIEIFSPSDYTLAQQYVQRTLNEQKPKYIRFDAQPLPPLQSENFIFGNGFRVLKKSKNKTAYISTGYMTQKVFLSLKEKEFTIIDLYLLNNFDKKALQVELYNIEKIVTVEEGFVGAGGLDAIINKLFADKEVKNIGFDKKYTFEVGSRDFVHNQNDIILV